MGSGAPALSKEKTVDAQRGLALKRVISAPMKTINGAQ